MSARDKSMTKGQMEAKISEAFSKFEIEFMGRGPRQIKTHVLQDMVVVRMMGFLSPSERRLAETPQGVELIKKLRIMLFEGARNEIEAMLAPLIGTSIVSVYSDVSTKSGEKIVLVTLGDNLEERLCK